MSDVSFNLGCILHTSAEETSSASMQAAMARANAAQNAFVSAYYKNWWQRGTDKPKRKAIFRTVSLKSKTEMPPPTIEESLVIKLGGEFLQIGGEVEAVGGGNQKLG